MSTSDEELELFFSSLPCNTQRARKRQRSVQNNTDIDSTRCTKNNTNAAAVRGKLAGNEGKGR